MLIETILVRVPVQLMVNVFPLASVTLYSVLPYCPDRNPAARTGIAEALKPRAVHPPA